MLRGIRTASANWLGKLVMGVVVGVLAISFAIWGIGDIFRGFGRSVVATVGSTDITAENFRNIYNERIQQLSQQLGRPIPPDQARALGLDRQILGQLISEMALDEWAHRLGLGITDEEVARLVRTIPAFHDADGNFDHSLFLQRLRAAGYTEPRFIAEQRRVMIRQHLIESVGGVTLIPKTYRDAINAYQNEQRAIEFVTLGAAQAGDIPNATPEELTSYFESRKALFRAPEYRKIAFVRLTPDEVNKWIQVSDEEARTRYDSARSRYVTPGRRQVQQITFPDADEAKKAKERIAAGTSFEDIAKERGLTPQDIDLGFIGRADRAITPQVLTAAFSLPEGGVSEPVQSRLGFALLRVVKIEPDVVRPFEEAVAEIKQEIARERGRTELGQKHDAIEDERAGGANLADAAKKAGLEVVVVQAVDRSGRDPSGAQVTGLPADVDIITPAFATQVGAENEAVRLETGGYIWFEVQEITPSRERTLEEVRERVAARWRDEKIAERLTAKAKEMIEKLKSASFADVAKADNLTVETANELKRNSRPENFPATMIPVLFRTPKGEAATAEGASLAQRVVFRVTEVNVPALDAEAPEAKRVDATLRNAIAEDLLRQYLIFVEAQVGTTVNADVLRRVVGGEQL